MKIAEVLRLLHEDGWYLVATRGEPPPVQAPDQAWSRDCPGQAQRRRGPRHPEQHPEASRAEVRL